MMRSIARNETIFRNKVNSTELLMVALLVLLLIYLVMLQNIFILQAFCNRHIRN